MSKKPAHAAPAKPAPTPLLHPWYAYPPGRIPADRTINPR